jgi:hypothetical protein
MNKYEIRILRCGDRSEIVVTATLLGDHAAVRRAQMLAGNSAPVEVWRGVTCVYSSVPKAVRPREGASSW